MEDVTDHLLNELTYALRGESVQRAQKATPAKALTPALEEELARLNEPLTDRTMGFISNALSYSRQFRDKKQHTKIIRLIKGGHVRVIRVYAKPTVGTIAHRDAPYGESYYVLEPVK